MLVAHLEGCGSSSPAVMVVVQEMRWLSTGLSDGSRQEEAIVIDQEKKRRSTPKSKRPIRLVFVHVKNL